MARRSLEPLLWLLFSAGGVASALFVPILVLLFGLAFPLGWLSPPSHEHLSGVNGGDPDRGRAADNAFHQERKEQWDDGHPQRIEPQSADQRGRLDRGFADRIPDPRRKHAGDEPKDQCHCDEPGRCPPCLQRCCGQFPPSAPGPGL
jgi:hypothetical protein